MKNGLSKNSMGLTLGTFVGAVHVLWLLLVGTNFAATVLNWCLAMHHVDLTLSVLPFNWLNALMLVVMTFVGGYVVGFVVAALWNLYKK